MSVDAVPGESAAPTHDRADRSHNSWVKATWPVDRRQWLQLAIAMIAAVGVFAAIGVPGVTVSLLVACRNVDLLAPNPITRLDDNVANRLVSGRTAAKDDLAHWGAFMASTEVKVVVTSLLAVAVMVAWRRWHETVFLAFTLIFEATVFIVVTSIVGRPRPDVPRLEDSSYPSGHVAAATVYGAFVVIVFWHTTSRWIRSLSVGVFVAVLGAVVWSRLYQGMHFLSDVIAGIVLGLVSLGICLFVIGRPDEASARASDR